MYQSTIITASPFLSLPLSHQTVCMIVGVESEGLFPDVPVSHYNSLTIPQSHHVSSNCLYDCRCGIWRTIPIITTSSFLSRPLSHQTVCMIVGVESGGLFPGVLVSYHNSLTVPQSHHVSSNCLFECRCGIWRTIPLCTSLPS